MKRLMVVLVVLLVFSVSAYAQMGGDMSGSTRTEMSEQKGEMKPCGMMMEEGTMPMMQMMPMCQQMMQMMMDMMNMQEKMIMGVKPSEKKKMMKDMAQMKERMKSMMSMHAGMDDSQKKLKCAEEWLKKAIDLHEVHIKDPKTATDASQHEMMDQMKKAYECITGKGSETMTSKEPAVKEQQKVDPHKH